jgi:FKBP-type peptidyl-prolyl cis-trans isomerase
MKHSFYIIPFLIAALLCSCKTDNWIDWKAQNEMFMIANGKRPDIITTATGLQYKVIADPNPSDAKPNSTSNVVCDYKLELINGAVLDSTTNAYMSLSGVIPGFVEGIRKIHVQGDVVVYVPWKLGYGEKGTGTEGYESFVPPYSTLIYNIHLTALTN